MRRLTVFLLALGAILLQGFAVQTARAQAAPPEKWSDHFCLARERCTVGDVNGDGRIDLITFVSSSAAEPMRNDVYVALSDGRRFNTPQKWSDLFCLAAEYCTVGDVNGDGRVDLITFVGSSAAEPTRNDVYVALSNSRTFSAPQKWSDLFCLAGERCTVGDVNHDGRADLITFIGSSATEPKRNDVWIALSDGRRFNSPQKWNDHFCLAAERCTAGDVNGDGRIDLITFVSSSAAEPTRNDVYVALSDGRRFNTPQKWSDLFCLAAEYCTVGDVDGDGRADLITFVGSSAAEPTRNDVYVALSNSRTFSAPQKWSDLFCLAGERCTVGDVNHDGRADLITFIGSSATEPKRNDVWIALSN